MWDSVAPEWLNGVDSCLSFKSLSVPSECEHSSSKKKKSNNGPQTQNCHFLENDPNDFDISNL
jgi:hypothetical protein